MSIFSEYNNYNYIYPPRAETTIHPDLLKDIGGGWIAQPKYNGSCAILFIDGYHSFKIYNRHAERLTLQTPLCYNELNDSDKFMVLCGEYLNKNKKGEDGNNFNHKFIIWDILVWQGKYLIGETVENRLNILYKLFGSSRGYITGAGITMFNHLFVTNVESVFLAPSYLNDFKPLFDEISQVDLYEGLVLKKSDGKLEPGFREKNNSSWQMKTRKPTKNYSF